MYACIDISIYIYTHILYHTFTSIFICLSSISLLIHPFISKTYEFTLISAIPIQIKCTKCIPVFSLSIFITPFSGNEQPGTIIFNIFIYLINFLICCCCLLPSLPDTLDCHYSAPMWMLTLFTGVPMPSCMATSISSYGYSLYPLWHPTPGCSLCPIQQDVYLLNNT